MSGLRDLRTEGVPPIIIALIIVLGALLVFELAVPRMIASRLENAVRSSVDSIDYVRVRLRSFPAINLISSGRVNSVSMNCKGLFIEGLRIESLMVDASDILIDMQALREESRFSLVTSWRSDPPPLMNRSASRSSLDIPKISFLLTADTL